MDDPLTWRDGHGALIVAEGVANTAWDEGLEEAGGTDCLAQWTWFADRLEGIEEFVGEVASVRILLKNVYD